MTSKHQNLEHKFQSLEAENGQLKTKILGLEPLQPLQPRALLKTSPPIVNSEPLSAPVLTMANFQQHKRDNDSWYSPPVYTHHQGYKICLKVYANGSGSGKRTHVSVYVCFMRGEFDDSLTWPFQGTLTLQLLNQVNGDGHVRGRNIYNNDKTPNMHGSRVTVEEISLGWGKTTLIAHSELEPKYLRNDTLLFQVFKEEMN